MAAAVRAVLEKGFSVEQWVKEARKDHMDD